MKRLRHIILACLGVCLLSAFNSLNYLPEHLGKKVEKNVYKLFGKTSSYSLLPLDDTTRLNHDLFAIHLADSLTGYAMVSRALGCRIGGCDKPDPTDTVAFEEFYYMTSFNPDKTIKQVRILEYTSNYGYQIANKGWLKQFTKARAFEVGRNIDGISGATISVESITKGVNQQIAIIDRLK